ncbi:MAG: MarR family transcriptional regulator [Bacilli bacterium]|nr:MarR family transcriptional regulator [Bacilli bacterium]
MQNDKYDSLKLKNQLCFPIYLSSKEIIRKYTPLLKSLDLTYTQYIVMMYFWENKSSNVKSLGEKLLLDSSTLTPLLKKLENKGYIERKRSNEDERNLVIKITPEGENLKDKALNVPEKIGQCINLTEEEAKTLYLLINKILFNIEKDGKNENSRS